MTWVLWTLVPMVDTPRGRSEATFVRVLAQSEYGQFCHFGICGPNWDCHHTKWHEDLLEPGAWESLFDCWWIAYGMADPISKQAWRYTIGSTPKFWLISSSQNDPLLGPQFHPPRVVNRRLHISMPTRSLYPIPGCTLRYWPQVLPPILWAIGLALAGRTTRGNDANFSDFGIMIPLDEPLVP